MINSDKFLEGKRIAIVGGAGFIGHNLALRLKKKKAKPFVIDGLQVNNLGAFTCSLDLKSNNQLYLNFINSRLDLIRKSNIPLYVLDVRDYHAVSPCLNSIKPDVVIHLAAVAHANRSNKDPFSTFDHSMRTIENSLDSIKDRKPHLIFLSSSMVYGNFEKEFVDEDTICEPLGIYGALKFGAEKLVIAYNQVFKLPYTIIRPSALYGERCVSRRVGQAFIENAIIGKDLNVNGDGSDKLDFTYIDDLCQGIMLCISESKAKNQIFNLTYGDARSINDLANIIKDEFPKIKINYNPKDVLMPERGTLDISKAKKILNYKPKFSIEKGFRNYIKWYKNFSKRNSNLF